MYYSYYISRDPISNVEIENVGTADCAVFVLPVVVKIVKKIQRTVMQEASDTLSKTADSDNVSTYQVSSMQLVTDKKPLALLYM